MGSAQKLLWPEWLLGGEQRVLWPGWLVESAKHWERKKVPHLRWSQAPPLPWLRQGSADTAINNVVFGCVKMVGLL